MRIRELEHIIVVLETATRQGIDKDEPEGARYIQISDTLAKEMVEALRQHERNQQRQIEDLLSD